MHTILPLTLLLFSSLALAKSSNSEIRDFLKQYKKQVIGTSGYVFVANQLFDGDMEATYKNVSKLIPKSRFLSYGWKGIYHGDTSDYKKEYSRLFESEGIVRGEFLDVEGYIRFSRKYYFKSMSMAYKNLKSVLSKRDFARLNWGPKFPGTTAQRMIEFSRIYNIDGTIKERYIGRIGYLKYAIDYHDGNMAKAHSLVYAIIKSSEHVIIDWGRTFSGNVKSYSLVIDRILSSPNRVITDFLAHEGYIKYADLYHNGNLGASYSNVSSVLSEKLFDFLDWNYFSGTTADLLRDKLVLIDLLGDINKEFKGQEGYIAFSDTFYDGRMGAAHSNVHSFLTSEQKKQLGWTRRYDGHTSEIILERQKIFLKNNSLNLKFIGRKGYVLFSDEKFDGRMDQAFSKMRAVLSDGEFHLLEWGNKYSGSTSQHEKEISRITNENEKIKEIYKGIEGYLKYSDDFYRGKMKMAISNVMAVLSDTQKIELGWHAHFVGTTTEFKKMRSFLYKSGSTEIDVKKWASSKEGLVKATELYLQEYRRDLPNNIKTRRKYRRNFLAVVTSEEAKALNWSVKKIKRKVKPVTIIDIARSVKKGTRR